MNAFRCLLLLCLVGPGFGQVVMPRVDEVAVQPLNLQVKRLEEALDYLGRPFSGDEKKLLEKARISGDEAEVRKVIQDVLDPHCLAFVEINPESRVKVLAGPAKPILVETRMAAVFGEGE